MFFCFGKTSTLVILVYVNDIIIIGSSPTIVDKMIEKLNSTFALRDLGNLSYFLGIEVSYDKSSMHLSPTKYISYLLHRTEMFNSELAKTPGIIEKNLFKFDGKCCNVHKYCWCLTICHHDSS